MCSDRADYEVDESRLLFFALRTADSAEERADVLRLVVPDLLQQDFLHLFYTSLEGGHHGLGRTNQKIHSNFHWIGLYRSVQRYVRECVDCVTQGKSPGNVQATYHFQISAMDHISSLQRSFQDDLVLLLWVDLFSGHVVAKASSSRTAQTIAENCKECVFRRFGASEAILHEREPGFMSDFSIRLQVKSSALQCHIDPKQTELQNVWYKL